MHTVVYPRTRIIALVRMCAWLMGAQLSCVPIGAQMSCVPMGAQLELLRLNKLLKPSVLLQACATSSAGKNCMCATPPAPTPAVSPSRREIGAEAFQTRLVKHTASMHLLPSIQEHTCAHLLRTPCAHDYTPVTSVHLYPPVLKCASLHTCCHLYPAPAPFSRASTL